MLPPFQKIYHLGHRDVRDIFDGPVRVEEKVDGSQFSFGVVDGALQCRSKGVLLDLEAPGMFGAGVRHVQSIQDRLVPGIVYRAEYLARPRHNVLEYNRAPKGHLVLWGIEGDEGPNSVPAWADLLGIDAVPLFMFGYADKESVLKFLERESFLGGPKIEGVVIKRGDMVAKFVSADFKEMHTGHKTPPKLSEDIRVRIAGLVCNENRFAKVRQHLRDDGKLVGGNEDIGALIRELHRDIDGECLDEIKSLLLEWALPTIKKTAAQGLPAWYKQRLQFESLEKDNE